MKLITVLSGVLILCAISVQSEKIEASLGEVNKFEEAPENDEEVESNWFELQHETIEQQADQPTSGEQFIAIRIGAAGSKDQVNPNLVGLVRMATQFLPKSYTFINVLSASREVVAGIKYELLIKALDENKSEVQCEIRILEQPWIIINNNEKLRTLIYSNCSTDQVISNEPTGDVQYNINPIFNNEEQMMTGERLKDMESLIMPNDNKTPKPPTQDISSVQPETIHSRPKEDEDALPVITLSKGTSSFLDDFFSFEKETKPKESSLLENEVIPKLETPTRIEAATIDRGEQENTIYGVASNANKETPIVANTETSIAANTETSTQVAAVEVNNNAEPVKEEVSIQCALTPTDENAPVSDTKSIANVDITIVNVERQKRASLDMEGVLLTKLINAALARLDRFDEDDNKRILLNVLESRAHRNIFTTDVRIADTKCSEISSSVENCISQIIDDSIKLCRFEIEHLDNGDIKLKKSECAPEVRKKRQVGAPKAVTESEQETVLGYLKGSLANGDAPGYKLDRIIEITKQTVAGVLYKIKAQFEVEQALVVCNVEIWDRPWLGESAREVTFKKCDDAARRKRQIVGDISSLPNSDGEKLLNEVLSEGDYQSYRLVRLIESSQQTVAGVLYRIKAEFSVDHLTKICVVQIWDRPWLGKSARQVEFNCDGSSRKKRQVPGGISPSSESDKSNKIAGLLNEILTEGDYKSYRLVKIIESTIQRASGTIYKIKGEFSIEQSSKICNIKIWDRPWLGKSGREVEFNCDDLPRPKRQIQGGFKSIKVLEKEIDTGFISYMEDILKDILRNTDYQSYKLIKIIDTTSEVMAGFMYRIKAEFSVNSLPKICNIKIWDKESIQEREVQEFMCHDPELNNFRDKPLITAEDHSNYEYISDGGPTSDVSTDSSDQEIIQIESLLNNALESTIYKSHKLVRIIEFTKLNVTDILYRIKASFKINQTEQICDLELWEKTSDRENAIQEFNCIPKSSNNGFNLISEKEKPKVEKLLREVLAYDDYQSYTLVRILQCWQQFVVGINYKVRAEMKVKGDSKICDIKILAMFTKHGKRVVQTVCQNVPGVLNSVPSDSPVFIESLVNGVLLQGNYQSFRLVRIIEWSKQTREGVLYRVKAQFAVDGTQQICNLKIRDTKSNKGREIQEFICDEPTESILGGISVLSEKDKPLIENILNEILTSGNYPSYKLVRIIESTKQIVKGILYRIKAEFIVGDTTKICNFKIWEKNFKEGREVQEVTCVEPSRPLPGGITTTSQDDKSAIENILNGVLASGDYQRYRLLRIIESTKQIVAGILYRIRAEFSVNGTQKICNIKIWDKVSNQGREVQEFICEEPASSILGGSHVTGDVSTIFENNKPTEALPHAAGAHTTFHEHSAPILGGISATTEDDKTFIENILNGVLASGDYQSYRLVRIIESTKQIVAGILYRIKAEFSVSGTQKICNVQILDKVSNQGREVQEFICEEPASSIVGGSHVTGDVSAISENNKSTEGLPHAAGAHTTFHEHNGPILGGISATTEDDKTFIENILNGVLASGDYQSYRLVRIIESTKQIVAGILYRIKAEFSVSGTQKICNVKILDKVSNQGREVQEFTCEEPASSTVGASHATGDVSAISENNKSTEGLPHAAGTHTTFHEHNGPILGGISATTEDDKTFIENILNGVLASGDYQSYRLVRIIESTKQIVAGILYRIKAEFSVSGTQKICNVKILDKVSNQGREVQEFTCEEPASSTVGASHATGDVSAISENNKSTEGLPHAAGTHTTFHEHNAAIKGGISATSEDDKTFIENILNGVLASGDYQSYRLVRIIESTKQIVAGILYRIKAEFSVSGTQKICNVKILDKVSNQGREVQEFTCEEPASSTVGASHATGDVSAISENNKSTEGLPHAAGAHTTFHEHNGPILGGISATTEDDKTFIENILNGVLASGDYQSYRLVRIIESTKQIVAGILYRIKAEFSVSGTQKICNVKILDKVSNQGREVQEFTCEEPASSTVGASHATGDVSAISENNKSTEGLPHAAGTHTTFHEHNAAIKGGISATSEDDKTFIENILNGVLASGDYQSYRLVRIIESTKQIVAGILYRIKAEFSVSGTQKICNVKILDKVSNQGREVQEFTCEEPASSIVGASHATGDVSAISENNKSTEGVPHAAGAYTTFLEHNAPILGGISATSEDDKTFIENILNGVLASGDYQSYRLVRIIESTKQIVAGILYRIKAEFSVSGTQKICNVQILDKVSNQGREVQEFICEDPASSIVGGSHVTGDVSAISENNKSTEAVPHAAGAYTTFLEHNAPILGGISATSEDDKTFIENILNGVLASGDYQSYRLVRIIESTKQIVAGILYRIKAEFSVSGTQKICNVQILDKVSNQGREVQEFICEEPASSIVGGSHATGDVSAIFENNKSTEGLPYAAGTHTTFHEHNAAIKGGISATSEDDKTFIENILNGVLASGDYQSYRLVRIIESTKQIVAGILYRIKAEFSVSGTQKICNVQILDKVSNQGREVQEFICDEPASSIVGGSHATGDVSAIFENNKSTEGLPHAAGTHTTFHEHNAAIKGGISATSEDDKTFIENILNGVLASGDYQSYRLVRIIESTKQLVAGILYRIKAEFSVSGTQKICNVKILDKVSNQGREVQEFICEEPASSIVGGSHATGDVSAISENNKSTEGLPHAAGTHTTFHEHNAAIKGGISATSEDDKTFIENILNGVLASGDYQSYRLVRIIESTKQIVAGILYRIKAEFSVSGTQKICNVQILDKVSNQGREVQEFICEEPASSIVGGSHATGDVSAISENNKSTEGLPHVAGTHTSFHEHNTAILGGISATSEDDKTFIENILNGVLASGDYQSYRLVRIIEFTKQIVAGILYRIKAEFSVSGTQKICNVQIFDKVSNQGREVQEFICEDPASSIVGGSHATGDVSAISENNKSTEELPHVAGTHTSFHEHNTAILGGISATSEDDKTFIENILNGVLASGDYQSYRLVRIIEFTKQIVAGILYRIKAEFSVSGTQKICNVQIFDKVSNQGREVQEFICEDPASSIVGGSHSTGDVSAISEHNKSTQGVPHAAGAHTTFLEHNAPILGGISATSENDKTFIENILNGVLASGDYQSYRLVRIIESTKQIVAGILYRIKAEFSVSGTQKICNVQILDKVSNQGREVQEFICEDPASSIVGESHVTGNVSAISENNKSTEGVPHAAGAYTTFLEHNAPILGGISATSEDDKTFIENILNGVLASGDYQSYRLVRIIESTKQIVAGILYRIKAEFSVSGTQKICNLKIWDKVSNQGREVQEFICEEPASSIVGGSHVTGDVSAISENNKSTEGLPHAAGAHTTFHEHSAPILGGISATSEDDKTFIENILNGVLASGDYQSYRLVRIIKSTKQIVAGILYRIKAEFSVSGTQKICNVQILDKVSNQGREVQEFICEEPASSIVGGSHATGDVSAISENNKSTEGVPHAAGAYTTFLEHNAPILGGISATSENDKTFIENILNGVLASGDYQSYRLVRIIESTKQIVAGILYRIKAEFSVSGTQKICNVQILDKVSNQGREVQEFICEEPASSIVGGSHATGDVSAISENNKSTEGLPHAAGTHTTFHEHNAAIKGGISATSEDDKTFIENILNGVLASGDYQSYRLVRIIESTKQIVAGILYRIKAEFSVSGTQKICNVQILDKVSNQGREVQEFICEDPASSIVGGSHATGDVSAIFENNKSTEGLPHAAGTHTTFHEHNAAIKGGISATSEDDKTFIENILNGVLASGDYQSYRLVRIIESTKQIVAGILYRIKAEFSVSGTQKICNVKILDKVSNQGREVQEFICEDPASSIVGGSHVTGNVSAISENNKSTEGVPHAAGAYTTFLEHNAPILGGISATSEDDKTFIENILNGVLASGDYQSYRLVRIIESTKQIVAGILYRIKAEFSVSGTQKICNVQILDKVSNQGREVQEFICEDPASSIVGGSHVTGDVSAISENNKSTEGVPHAAGAYTTFLEHNAPILGGISATSEDDKTFIENILNGVLASGDYQSYRLVRIIESTKQIVAGILYRIKAEFSVSGTQKICNVQILDKVSNQGREVQEFICEEPASSIVGGSHATGDVSAIFENNKSTEGLPHAAGTHTTFHEHNAAIKGGISATSEDDKTFIENILNGVLASGDYQSYRLVRIIESTKQIVAGILYRIKAEFSVSGTQKICNVKILDKVSNQGREVQEFTCEEPASSIVGASHATGDVSAISENNKSTEGLPHAAGTHTTFHEHNAAIKGGISATSEDDKTFIENILNGVLASGDYQSYRLVRIIESTKQIVAGILYRIKAEFSVSGTQKICNVQILDKVSNQGREVQEFICEDPASSIVGGSHVTGNVSAISENNKSTEGVPHAGGAYTTFLEHNAPILGGISATSEDDKTFIENILNGVLASGDYQSYRLVRIIESTKQIVAGILYRIKAEFSVSGTQKICNVKILDKVSNQGREVQEFTCEEPASSIVGASHATGDVSAISENNKSTEGLPHAAGTHTIFHEHNAAIKGGISATSEDDKTFIENILNGVLASGDYQSYRLVRIIESTKQIVAGILYRIKAEFSVSGTQKICNVKILDKVSNQGREVQEFTCEEPASSIVGASHATGDVSAISENNKSTEGLPHAAGTHTTFHEHNAAIKGGISATSEDDKTFIENILNGVLASGDYQSYRLVRIIESTKQIVAGILYSIKAEFSVSGTQKICNVKILDKVSNQGREVQEFTCEEPASSIVGASHATGDVSAISENNKSTEGLPHAAGTHTTFYEHNAAIKGGISATSEDDKTFIENILNGVLASGDYQSYRLVRIIESTKQIVAGILYRIKAEFSVSGTQKICNVQILDKVSNQGREVQEFICEEPASSIVGGSHATGDVSAIFENNKSTEGLPHAAGTHTTFHEHNAAIKGGISATSEDDKTFIENILNGVLASGDYQSYRLVRIIESTKQIVAGILYRIKAEFSVSGTQKICNVKILDKVSNQGREVQEFICEDPASSIVGGSHSTGDVSAISENNKSTEGLPHAAGAHTTFLEHNAPILGGISATSEDDKTFIENILNGVLASGDYQSYRLVRIIESTKQIVAGILYRIKAEFSVSGTQKICNVQILDKVSNQGREVQEFICEEPASSIVGGSHVTGDVSAISENNKSTEALPHAAGVHTTFHEHSAPILGGISATSEDDKTFIENILNEVLASGDYQSYRLVRIIESTKQIVAGILYRIKAEFSVDGTQKICNVQILDKISNLGREVQEFICEEPSALFIEGSHEAYVSTETHDISRHPAESISASSEDDKSVIENILNVILAGGDYQSYKLVRLIEFSNEVKEGVLYRIKADFLINGVDHICAVKIWDRSAQQGEIRHKISCRQTFPILGGFNSFPLDDISSGQNLLIDILAYDDYHKYKLVKVIESWKQIVNGVHYKIKAELTEAGVPKICNILILDKLTEDEKYVAEFDCKNIAEPDHNIQGHIPSITVADNSKIESLLTEILSQGNFRSYRRIIESTIETVSGILYRIKGEFEIDGSSNVCNVKIWDRPGLGKSERQVKIKCDEQSRHKRQVPGGVLDKSVTDTKIESILNEVLVAGDYSSYRLIRIIESTTQVVAGNLYRIKAEFSIDQSTKVCSVKIWDRPWLGKASREVEFNCDGLSRRKRQIRGGVAPVSEENKPYVANLLNEVLTAGDYQSYRLVKIIETSRQVVAGTLYRIKAEFDLDGAEKICDITIWQKINNENEVTKFSCVRKRGIRRRSHGSSSSSSESSGSSESSERSNKNKIRNVLYDVLDDDDYKSYSLVRINQGSRQKLSSRTLYYIEAIFLVDKNEIQCNVNINQRSRTDRKVHFNCDQQTIVLPPSGGTIIPISERDYIQNLVTEVLSEGEYQSYRLLRIIEASSQEASGYKYRIKADFAIEQVEKICVINIWVKLSNRGKEITEFTCEEPEAQQEQNTVFLWRKTRQVRGGTTKVSELDKPHVESLLNDVLLTGEYQLYSLIEIIESKKQIVQGTLYTIKAKFNIDSKTQTCTVTIWDRPWLGKSSREVEFKECVGDTSVRNKRQIVAKGSVRPVEQNEYPKIEEMLNTALAAGDQQNYRLARVFHASKQLTSGWTYKIRAAFEVDGVTKRCNIKLWNRPWLSNASTIESFKCDEHDEHTIRSNHDDKIKRTLDHYLHNNFTDNKIFEIYEKLYNKNYQTTLSRNLRLRIFKTNIRKIRNLIQHERGTATYGITEFADLTPTEYRLRTGLVRRSTHTNHISNPIASIPNIVLPREFDWRTRGAVSQVKNQGSCGSCWAFSVIGNIEGLHAIKTGSLEEYSEQELVDCDTIDNGCNGGLPDDAYKAIEQIGGLETEKDYPYTAHRDHCAFNETKVKTQIKGAVDLPKNETAIAQWLLQNGPVSIGINANAMQFYRGGVSHPWHMLCSKSDLDHGVLIVGFGVHDYPKFKKSLPYWIVKNSWGPSWGEQGYYRVYRGDNTCGVSEMVSSAVLE